MKTIILMLTILGCTIATFGQVKLQTKKKIPIVVSTTKKPVHKDLKIISHEDGGQGCGIIQILGTGEPGLEITVSLFAFAKVTTKGGSIWSAFKKSLVPFASPDAIVKEFTKKSGTVVKEKFFESYKVTIDKNGKWSIPAFASFGRVEWMSAAFIPFAWNISALATDPSYREGNVAKITIGCEN